QNLVITPGQIVAHTCGAHGTDILAPLAERGAITMALHPAMTFTGTSLDLPRLRDCPFAVTCSAAMLPLAHALIADIGASPVTIANADRPAYHAALAHAANHSVLLISQARRIVEQLGEMDPGRVLRQLVFAAVDGALRSGEGALTGPVMRGDSGTVRAHLNALADLDLADVAMTYRQLALATAHRCGERRQLNDGQLAEITGVLRPRMEVCTTVAQLRAALAIRPGKRAVVMTMGALHDGHLALVRRARQLAQVVVATVYVNPLQFAPNEDFDAYPRDLDRDVALLREAGVDVVFAPSDDEMYPRSPLVRIDPGEVAGRYEGVTRPTHFAGVLQVVLKLLHLTGADVAVFGEKDAQQLALIRQMVRDLNVPVDIVGVEISRDDDGVARSSRNAYLSASERVHARALSQALADAAAGVSDGSLTSADAIQAQVAAALEDAPGVQVDYVAAVDAETFLPADATTRRVIVVLAAWVGAARLLDNRHFDLDRPAHR
ncbi:MAG: pantoate--beta-alanine ligase, partial [Bowdeniella nasicola]|nr:pantoate--beta-alanine ligase [Bowdeniella nasicola]